MYIYILNQSIFFGWHNPTSIIHIFSVVPLLPFIHSFIFREKCQTVVNQLQLTVKLYKSEFAVKSVYFILQQQ